MASPVGPFRPHSPLGLSAPATLRLPSSFPSSLHFAGLGRKARGASSHQEGSGGTWSHPACGLRAGGCSAAAIGEACSLNPGSAGRPSPGPPEPQYPRRHSEIGRGKKETCLFSLPLLSQLIWPGSCFFLLSPLTSCLFLMTHFWETAPETTISGFIHKGQRRQLHPAHPKRGKNPSRALASPCNGALLPPAPLPPAGCHGNAPSVRTGPSISSLHPSSPPSLCLQGLCTLSR